MRISCPKDDLLKHLQVVARGVSQRSSVQILSGVLIDAKDAEAPVELAATDMELSVRGKLAGRRPRAGARRRARAASCSTSCATCRRSRSCSQSGDGPGLLTLECGASRYSLHTYDADDFPRLPEIDHGRTFGVDKDTFLQAADRVLRAASRDDSRPVLTGVLVEFADGVLTMAATDSYRMAVRTTTLEGGPPEQLTAIVPARALSDLIRISAARRRRGPRDRRRGEPGALRHRRTSGSAPAASRASSPSSAGCCPTRSSTRCRCRARSSPT